MSGAGAGLRRIVVDLTDLGRRFALVGGLAVSVRTAPRLTPDSDLAVLVTDDGDAEALVRDLAARGWRALAAMEQSAARRLATVRLSPASAGSGGTVVDLLVASSGIEPEVVTAADDTEALAPH